MEGVDIRPMETGLLQISPEDRDAILALNNAYAIEMSWLDSARLRHLLENAYYARMVQDCSAFLIAFTLEASYDNPNFKWFSKQLEGFVYVDRIAVASWARGRGLARFVYADLFSQAARDGFSRICCEVNIDPPNPASDALHAALGFHEIGRCILASGKTVRYLLKEIHGDERLKD